MPTAKPTPADIQAAVLAAEQQLGAKQGETKRLAALATLAAAFPTTKADCLSTQIADTVAGFHADGTFWREGDPVPEPESEPTP